MSEKHDEDVLTPELWVRYFEALSYEGKLRAAEMAVWHLDIASKCTSTHPQD